MKHIVTGILIVFIIHAHGQSYDKPPLSSEEIEKGIEDFNYLRAVLLEKGFKFEEKFSKGERWRVLIEGNDYRCQICIQFSNVTFHNEVFGKHIFLQIRKDLLPKYNQNFLSIIKANYPEKRAEPITIKRETVSGTMEEDSYRLIYFSHDKNIEIEFEEENLWAKYSIYKEIRNSREQTESEQYLESQIPQERFTKLYEFLKGKIVMPENQEEFKQILSEDSTKIEALLVFMSKQRVNGKPIRFPKTVEEFTEVFLNKP